MTINKWVGVGRLTKAVDLRYTPAGKAVANGTIAINRPFGKDEVDFINFVAWEKKAEVLANYTDKGSQVGLVGRVQVRNYENNEGKKVYVTEIVADEVALLDSKKDKSEQRPQENSPASEEKDPDELPF